MRFNTLTCVLIGLVAHSSAVPTKREAVNSCLTQAKVPTDAQGSQTWKEDGTAYNLRLPFEPAAIAVPTTVAQVSAAVECGAKHGVAISAKSGGHSYTSLGFGGEDGHLMIELDRMYSVKVAKDGTAKIQPGARLGHVATELWNQGKRALSHGTCPGVGLGGHALHGGYGMVARKHGLTLDLMIGATVVLPTGKVVHCSKTENSDLFWGIRGAGANFGVVVELEFQTFPAPEQITYFDIGLNWDKNSAPQGLYDFQEFGKGMPAEITMQMAVSKNGYSVDGAYIGDEASLRKALQPLVQKFGGVQVTATTVDWMQLVTHYAGAGVNVNPTSPSYDAHDNFYASSLAAPELTLAQFKSFVNYVSTTGQSSSHSWWLQMDITGGTHSAVSKPKPSDTAYVHRDTLLLFQFYDAVAATAQYPSDGFGLIKGLRQSISNSLKEGTWGMYANYPDSQIKNDRATEMYWGSNVAKLQTIKAKYDPKNLFRNPQSIKPKA
ncbi:6-hydroxy-d-nicotine oxidase [Fusarium sporotrichioides]|uniref:6-hydroxy-d-nicotine oxidase n=1 Tax=Fusarium sporotrichioides TaxID=5514 RepID=A0A395SAR3_FUSSP|nr:6-hydroxy-d-nicotine oxidase [Fusarium sporotrichioides]